MKPKVVVFWMVGLVALAVAIACLHDGVSCSITFPFEKDKSIWTQLGFFVPLAAAAVALLTFIFTRQQSERQFQTRLTEDRFLDALTRAADGSSEPARSSAALRLAELATYRQPSARGKALDEYPYILRATLQLLASLLQESSDIVRKDVSNAIQRVLAFCVAEKPELLKVVTLEILRSNIRAKDELLQAIGWIDAHRELGLVLSDAELAIHTRISSNASACEAAVLDMLRVEGSNTARSRETAQCRLLAPEELRLLAFERLRYLSAVGSKCYLIRQNLAMAVRELGIDENYEPFRGNVLKEGRETDFGDAILVNVILRDIPLCKSRFTNCRLHRADLSGSDLSSSDMTRAKVAGAKFRGAILKGTRVYGLSVEAETSAGLLRADFSECKWSEANFEDISGRMCDWHLRYWLTSNFPEDKVNAPSDKRKVPKKPYRELRF